MLEQEYGAFEVLGVGKRGFLPSGEKQTCDMATFLPMGGYQNYGPFLGPYYNTAPNI